MKDYSNLTRSEMASLTYKELSNLTIEQIKKIHTDILCALTNKFEREEPPHERLVCDNGCNSWADEDIKLFCSEPAEMPEVHRNHEERAFDPYEDFDYGYHDQYDFE